MIYITLLKGQPFLVTKEMIKKYGTEKILALQEFCFRHNYKELSEDDFIKFVVEQ